MIRGIQPELLLTQIENTAPFIWQLSELPYIKFLFDYKKNPRELSHTEYFELCLCAHYATVATFIPTDVDNQIRLKLWQKTPLAVSENMAELVLESRSWNFLPVTTRFVKLPGSEKYVSGHQGEWFSMAVAAYACHIKRNPGLAEKIFLEIEAELKQEEEILLANIKAKKGIDVLKTSALIAHNLGALDRVMEAWNLPENDPLRKNVYKLGHEPKNEMAKNFARSGNWNKQFMAAENHRHFALREPKCLRRSLDFLLPVGPFFDDWGARLARNPEISPEELVIIIRALIDGWERLNSKNISYGYARALSGMIQNFPVQLRALTAYLPANVEKRLKSGELQKQILVSKEQFEKNWQLRVGDM